MIPIEKIKTNLKRENTQEGDDGGEKGGEGELGF